MVAVESILIIVDPLKCEVCGIRPAFVHRFDWGVIEKKLDVRMGNFHVIQVYGEHYDCAGNKYSCAHSSLLLV